MKTFIRFTFHIVLNCETKKTKKWCQSGRTGYLVLPLHPGRLDYLLVGCLMGKKKCETGFGGAAALDARRSQGEQDAHDGKGVRLLRL